MISSTICGIYLDRYSLNRSRNSISDLPGRGGVTCLSRWMDKSTKMRSSRLWAVQPHLTGGRQFVQSVSRTSATISTSNIQLLALLRTFTQDAFNSRDPTVCFHVIEQLFSELPICNVALDTLCIRKPVHFGLASLIIAARAYRFRGWQSRTA